MSITRLTGCESQELPKSCELALFYNEEVTLECPDDPDRTVVITAGSVVSRISQDDANAKAAGQAAAQRAQYPCRTAYWNTEQTATCPEGESGSFTVAAHTVKSYESQEDADALALAQAEAAVRCRGAIAVTQATAGLVSFYRSTNLTEIGDAVSAPGATALFHVEQRYYVTCKTTNQVLVLNDETLAVIATIPVGSNPTWMDIADGEGKLYVLNEGDETVSVIQLSSLSVIETISVGSSPTDLRVMARSYIDTYVAVVNSGDGTVDFIDVTTDTVVHTEPIADGAQAITGSIPFGENYYTYVINSDGSTVTELNIADFSSNVAHSTGVSGNTIRGHGYHILTISGSDVYTGYIDASTGDLLSGILTPNTVIATYSGGERLGAESTLSGPYYIYGPYNFYIDWPSGGPYGVITQHASVESVDSV